MCDFRRYQFRNIRFSPIHESTVCLIALASAKEVYVASWHYLLPLHYPMQRNWMPYADLINSANGVLWMTNASASFAAKSLPGGKFKWQATHAGMDYYG
jgi:hypothetical protein